MPFANLSMLQFVSFKQITSYFWYSVMLSTIFGRFFWRDLIFRDSTLSSLCPGGDTLLGCLYLQLTKKSDKDVYVQHLRLVFFGIASVGAIGFGIQFIFSVLTVGR